MTAPLCFASADLFELWLRSDMALSESNRCRCGPCTDCLPSYKLKMQKEGRCAHPETVFDLEREGGIFGRWPA